MTTTLRDRLATELDQLEPLPDLTPATLERGRTGIRRRRAGAGVATALALAAVGVAWQAGGTSGGQARDPELAVDRPSTPTEVAVVAIPPDYRERYPEQARIIDCMATYGQTATLTRDGAIFREFAEGEDTSGYDAASTTCRIEVTGSATGLLPKDYTASDWRSLYAQEKAAADCLRAHGQSVPAIPSLAEVRSSYADGTPWRAHGFVVDRVTQGEWVELVWDCPQPEVG